MCNLNGVKIVMRGMFAERKDWKKAFAMGAAGAAGLVVGQHEDHVQALMQRAALYFPEQLSTLASNPTAAAAEHGGRVLSGVASAAGALAQAAGMFVKDAGLACKNSCLSISLHAEHAISTCHPTRLLFGVSQIGSSVMLTPPLIPYWSCIGDRGAYSDKPC